MRPSMKQSLALVLTLYSFGAVAQGHAQELTPQAGQPAFDARELGRSRVVLDAFAVLSLKGGFAIRSVNDALIRWSKGSALLLIEGDEATELMSRLPSPSVIQKDAAGKRTHEITLASQGYVVCAKESFGGFGSTHEETACVAPMDASLIEKDSFGLLQRGCPQQQQQQQRHQQQQRQAGSSGQQALQQQLPLQQQQQQRQQRQSSQAQAVVPACGN
jgi:hypothetical protein